MTRKDAVVGLEFVIQVGNQDDYRNKDKDKTPIKGTGFGAKLNDSINEIHTWATKKFGAENIVSLDLHMDESSPHFHLVVTTVDAEKLNAKKWISGRTSIIELRKSCHEHVNKTFPCKYSNDVLTVASHTILLVGLLLVLLPKRESKSLKRKRRSCSKS